MKTRFSLLLYIPLVLALGFLGGCSDDDDNPTGGGGDPQVILRKVIA